MRQNEVQSKLRRLYCKRARAFMAAVGRRLQGKGSFQEVLEAESGMDVVRAILKGMEQEN